MDNSITPIKRRSKVRILLLATVIFIATAIWSRETHLGEDVDRPCAGAVKIEHGWPIAFYMEDYVNCTAPSSFFAFFFIPVDYLFFVLLLLGFDELVRNDGFLGRKKKGNELTSG